MGFYGTDIPGGYKDNLILKAEKLLKKDFQGLPNLADPLA